VYLREEQRRRTGCSGRHRLLGLLEDALAVGDLLPAFEAELVRARRR
jgi:hypothetical protein